MGECFGVADFDVCGNCNGDCFWQIDDLFAECGDSEFNNVTADCLGQCGGDAVIDACGDCDGGIDNPDDCYTLQYFTALPTSTGESQLLIISDATGVEPGDEIGL